jgi:acyl-CoA hydrolase
MPTTYGDATLPLDLIDYLAEVDQPLAAFDTSGVDPVSAAIGERVAAVVPDRATLQMGIGAIPDATLLALAERRGLRVGSEMFSDGVLALEKAGCLDPDTPVTIPTCDL